MKKLTSIFVFIFFIGCNENKQENHQQLKPDSMTFPVKNINISINASKDCVYEFASNPENFPKWLAFVKSVSKKSGNVWTAQSSLGQIEFDLVPENEFGVIDQVVTLPDGTKVRNNLRVIDNNEGSEVIFNLFKMPRKTDAEFEEDSKAVEADLRKLKEVMEKK